ncbi:MAG TPA: hypothetical protein PLQ57_06435 [Saprospiraceae bacterium]|nr:hypothetical protein [Saprospiraceae bacterium]HRG20646.1 hypothetical protein [Saprospiraceae bacterium]HRG64701.1 hypothetical protein [Saprospiraceae bacterium]
MKNNITSQNLIFFQALFELISGGVMLLIPFWFTGHFDPDELAMIKWAGIQDCAIGGLCYTIYRGFAYQERDRKLFLFLMAYHLVIAFHIYHVDELGLLTARWLYAAHFVFAFSFAIVYYLEKNNYHQDTRLNDDDKTD